MSGGGTATVGRRVGILGGGQLGRMMAEAAHKIGVHVVVLDPGSFPTPRRRCRSVLHARIVATASSIAQTGGADSPAGQIAQQAIPGSFRDAAAVRELAQHCDVVTMEIEHIDCTALEALEAEGTSEQPSPANAGLSEYIELQGKL